MLGLLGVPVSVQGAPGRGVVMVSVRQTYVRPRPSNRARHIGVVRRGARLATRGVVHGPGCSLGWVRLAGAGYICGDEVAGTRKRAGGPTYPILKRGRLLPFRYVAVKPEGSAEYLEPKDAASDYFLRVLAPRNAITVSRRVRYEGEWFYRTTRGTYVPRSEVTPVRASRFAGQKLKGIWRLPLSFVVRRRARIYRRPGRRTRQRVQRFERFVVLERKRYGGRWWVRVGPGRWLRRRDVRLARLVQPPPGIKPRQRWIDVDVGEQILTAYQGKTPMFVTLVSTGRRQRTPLGLHRVWVKLAATDMRSRGDVDRPYHLWDVPWTVFFRKGIGLHGTYWHSRFGHRKSAGCVNLSPRDARFVFGFVRPALPAGWWAVLARGKQGSFVRVRNSRQKRRRRRGRRRR